VKADLDSMTPRQIVAELDRHIIGQEKAKKAVAIAIRNRIRRQRLSEDLRDEVSPKNIILIGPTGVGKTEIARRIAKLSGAPFVKVEATKYTEVGYVGRDVESMVRDLMHAGVQLVRQDLQEEVRGEAEKRAEEVLLDLLSGFPKPAENQSPNNQMMFGIDLGKLASGIGAINLGGPKATTETPTPQPPTAEPPKDNEEEERHKRTRERMREKLRAGELEEREVEISVSAGGGPSIEILQGGQLDEMDLSGLSNMFGNKRRQKKLPVRLARPYILQEEMDRLVDSDRVAELARDRVQNTGIIFIDEIDKIASKGSSQGADVSRQGVQRDILPIVEGCQVNTKFGLIDTRHILFIAAGAFHMSKPSDLIPELQGRFPIRVELETLGADDFLRILTQPENAITRQYQALLGTEGIELSFHDDALKLLAELAAEVNSRTENIGARRLHTIMELLLEDLSFAGPELSGKKVEITVEEVKAKVGPVVVDRDLSRYIL